MTTDHSAIRDDADQHRSRLRRAYSAVACLVFGTAFMVPSAASAQATAIHPHAPARDGHRISRPVPKASRHAVARIAAVVSPAGASCQPVELVTFRGSAENDAKYHNGEGVMLGKLIDAAKAYPLKDGYSSADVPVYGVPYPAVGLDQYISADKTDLFDSIEYGRVLGVGYITARHAACPGTRFVLLGYSQGVAVARDVAQDVASDVIGGVFGIGDPYQKPHAPGVTGAGAGGSGLLRILTSHNGHSDSDAFYNLPIPIFTYCHAKDGICNPDSLEALTFYDHLDYGDDPVELAALAGEINILARNATAAGPPSSGGGGGGGGAPTKLATAVDIQSSANPSVYGQSVTFHAAVSAVSGSPTGSVSFFDEQGSLGSRPLSGGAASLTSSSLTPGVHQIVAYYGGDSTYASSSQALSQFVMKAATTTGLSASPNPSVYCQTVILHGTVAVTPPGAGTPTGTVTYTDGGVTLGSAALDSSGTTSSLSTQFFRVGAHPLAAAYNGDADFLASVSPVVSQVVNKAPTITTVASSPAGTNLFGRLSSFTATVTAPPPGCGAPTGHVQFAVDGVDVQSSTLDSASTATLATTALPPGEHLISVQYMGDDNFLPSNGQASYRVTCSRLLTGSLTGSVIASGESTCLLNARLAGAVVVPAGVRFAAVNSTIEGAVLANPKGGSNMLTLCGTAVWGALDVASANELVMIGDAAAACASNVVSGSVILRNNTRGLELVGNTVRGALLTVNNSGPGPYGQPSTMASNAGSR